MLWLRVGTAVLLSPWCQCCHAVLFTGCQLRHCHPWWVLTAVLLRCQSYHSMQVPETMPGSRKLLLGHVAAVQGIDAVSWRCLEHAHACILAVAADWLRLHAATSHVGAALGYGHCFGGPELSLCRDGHTASSAGVAGTG
jgi:hypothetical protein